MSRVNKLRTGVMASLLGIAVLLVINLPDEAGAPRTVAANIGGEHKVASTPPTNTAPVAAEAEEPPPPAAASCDHGHAPLDLAAIERDGERYIVKLPDKRVAELTLDPLAQEAAQAVLARAKAPRGAIVMMRTDGEVIALAGLRGADTDTPVVDPTQATDTWAPAASIFKIVTAAALVEAGVSPKQRTCYHGGLRSVMASNLRDDARRDRRCETLGYAIAKSQNALIGKLAHKHLDRGKLERAARQFGMGTAPSFCTGADESGFELPDDDLEFARVAAGFWKTELSALTGAVVANTVASGGMAVEPRLVRAIIDEHGNRHELVPPKPTRAIPEKVAQAVDEMMVGTIERGTGYKGFHDRKGRRHLSDVRVAGKTGTLTRAQPSYLQYSWFVGYAQPTDAPATVISVLLGNPARWHLKAHTAARLALQQARSP